MPNVAAVRNIEKLIKREIKKGNMSPDMLVQLGYDTIIDSKDYKDHCKNAFKILVKMNDLLTIEQKYAFMEQQGCHKVGKYNNESKAFAEKHADKSFEEKLELLNKEGAFTAHMKNDGTIVTTGCKVDDACGTIRSCHCINGDYKEDIEVFAKEYPDKILSFSQMYCGCCAGHQKHHLQIRLGAKLQLIEIGTSKTDKGCLREFIYNKLD